MTPYKLRFLCRAAIRNNHPDFLLVIVTKWEGKNIIPPHTTLMSNSAAGFSYKLCRFNPIETLRWFRAWDAHNRVIHATTLTLPKSRE